MRDLTAFDRLRHRRQNPDGQQSRSSVASVSASRSPVRGFAVVARSVQSVRERAGRARRSGRRVPIQSNSSQAAAPSIQMLPRQRSSSQRTWPKPVRPQRDVRRVHDRHRRIVLSVMPRARRVDNACRARAVFAGTAVRPSRGMRRVAGSSGQTSDLGQVLMGQRDRCRSPHPSLAQIPAKAGRSGPDHEIVAATHAGSARRTLLASCVTAHVRSQGMVCPVDQRDLRQALRARGF